MMENQPRALTASQLRMRIERVTRIARDVGFVGQVEYCHVLSTTGGAQFGLGSSPQNDLLVVYEEAFRRDQEADDFSLEAIVAHERGHQILFRNPRLRQWLSGKITTASEEILASLIGSILVKEPRDRENLFAKAVFECLRMGVSQDRAAQLANSLRATLELAL